MLIRHHFLFGGRGLRFIGGPLVLLVLVLLFAGAVALAVVLYSRGRHPTSATGPSARPWGQVSEASRILDERFARGEIDDEEYRRRKQLLSAGPSSSS
ncbi:MAG TPA: SHOCT domain-containing protein [Acidimicrobiales bacterium]|jgi:putative membrane protein|nr:SHOCT domain-containing protein [Acidimicrobiales bacterium]